MSMQNRPMQGKCGRIAVLLLLSPMMTLNASQATTLCVGHDGHVAIELVVDDHCTCEVRTSGTGADHVPAGTASSVMDERQQSCTDLSIPIGSCGSRTAPVPSKADSSGPATAPAFPSPAATGEVEIASPESPPTFIRYYTPLNSIILQV